ncbi:MAG: BPSS1780 family membrane protein [Comamonas sp.]
MHIKTVPARTGFQWLKLGFQTFWRQPLAWCLLLIPPLVGSMLTAFVPLVGLALDLASQPLLLLLMMVAAAQVATGHRLRPASLLAALGGERRRFHAMLALCALYAMSVLCLLTLQTLIAGDDLARVVLGLDPMNRELARFLKFDTPMHRSMAWVSLVTLFFWFTPGLVHWHGIAPLKALFLSAAACLRNWRALLILLLSWFGICTAVMWGMHLLCVLIAGQHGPDTTLSQVLIFAVVWVLMAPLSASVVFSFRDCFPAPDTDLQASASAGLNPA